MSETLRYKNLLITGGAGFIGANLSIKLTDLGYNVTVLDNLSGQVHGLNPEKNSPLFRLIKDRVNFIRGDVTSEADWEKAISGQNAIIHLAAETGTGQSMYEIEKYTKVNIYGTSLLWHHLANAKHSVSRVLVASSRAVYGEGRYFCQNDGYVYPMTRKENDMLRGDFSIKCPVCGIVAEQVATTEDSKIHPTSVYGFTKQSQEELSMIAGKSIKIPVVAFRYQNVYGPGQSLSNPYTGILSIFSTRIKNGNDINVFEDGNESRDFVYIDDVVNATILGLESNSADYQTYNVGTGIPVSVRDVAGTLIDRYESTVEVNISGQFRLGDIKSNYADISKIKAHLGYEPGTTFTEGITKFVIWVNSQEIIDDKYNQAMGEMKRKGLFK